MYIRKKILTPDNKIVEWLNVDHKGASAILPIDNDGKIILVKQYRNNAEDFVYEIPAGGFSSKDEDPLDCAIRELEEETGYKSRNITKLFSIYSSIGFCNEKIHYFVARIFTRWNLNLDPDEFIEIYKFSLEECLEMIYNGTLVDSKAVVSILSYALNDGYVSWYTNLYQS